MFKAAPLRETEMAFRPESTPLAGRQTCEARLYQWHLWGQNWTREGTLVGRTFLCARVLRSLLPCRLALGGHGPRAGSPSRGLYLPAPLQAGLGSGIWSPSTARFQLAPPILCFSRPHWFPGNLRFQTADPQNEGAGPPELHQRCDMSKK